VSEWECEHEEDLTLPEETFFRMRVTDIQTEDVPYTDKKTGEAKSFRKMTWWFEVTEQGKYVGRSLKGELTGPNAKLSSHPNNKFRQWAEAILDRDIPVGFQLSRDDLIGLQCKVSVRHEKGWKDPSQVFEVVDEVVPAGGFAFDEQPPF
jgi:hypothetical protein